MTLDSGVIRSLVREVLAEELARFKAERGGKAASPAASSAAPATSSAGGGPREERVRIGSDGDLAACHRFVGDEAGAMGSLQDGLDRARQATWLGERHVHRQEPCRSCWARYLCGGGCHHEVIRRGRPACDYIRGWLHYCLEAYLRLPRRRFLEKPVATSG